jgi:ferric-dicitrate binding protein FerR (iron transport regulator)
MNRKEAKALVTDWMAGEISARELKKLKVYLEENPTFRAEVNRFREAWDDLEDLEQDGYGVPYMGPALERKLQEASSNPDVRGSEPNSPETTCRCETVTKQQANTLKSGDGALRTLKNQLSSSRMVTFAAAASLVLFACMYVVFLVQFQQPGWTARITDRSSGTKLLRADRKMEVEKGMKVQSGDVLQVPGDGSATLTYRNENTSVVVNGDAKVRLREEQDTKYVSLLRGSMEVDLAEQSDRDQLVVSTNDARAKAVGTKFRIGHDQKTHLRVTQGRVLLSSLQSDDTRRIEQKEYATVTEDGHVISGDVFSGWVEEFDDVSDGARSDEGETAWEAKILKGAGEDGFSVSDREFRVHTSNEGSRLEDGGLWTSEEIDISAAEKVNVSVEFGEEKCGAAQLSHSGAPNINFELRIGLDGEQPKKAVGLSGIPKSPGVGVKGLEGSRLQVQIAAVNDGAPKCFSLERVSVMPD